MTSVVQSNSRFRPVSKAAFGEYAKNLSWLIERPLQQSQATLARIYGYADVHELHVDLSKPGQSGPFATWSIGGPEDADKALIRQRHKRALAVLASFAGCDVAQLPHRWNRVRDAKFFDPPAVHREAFRTVRWTIEALAGTGSSVGGLRAYATVEYTTQGTAFFAFTQKGKAIHCALVEVASACERGQYDSIDSLIEALRPMIEQRPANPFAAAMAALLITSEFPMRGRWSRSYTDEVARHAVPAIYGFEEMLGDSKDNFSRYRGDFMDYPHGIETGMYPAMLYWGGRFAATIGDHTKAEEWLSRCLACFETDMGIIGDLNDPFEARFVLAAIRLMQGRNDVKALFRTSDGTATGAFIQAIDEAMHENDSGVVAQHLGRCLGMATNVFEQFGIDDFGLGLQDEQLGQTFELMNLPFQEDHGDVWEAVMKVTHSDSVIEAAKEEHAFRRAKHVVPREVSEDLEKAVEYAWLGLS